MKIGIEEIKIHEIKQKQRTQAGDYHCLFIAAPAFFLLCRISGHKHHEKTKENGEQRQKQSFILASPACDLVVCAVVCRNLKRQERQCNERNRQRQKHQNKIGPFFVFHSQHLLFVCNFLKNSLISGRSQQIKKPEQNLSVPAQNRSNRI